MKTYKFFLIGLFLSLPLLSNAQQFTTNTDKDKVNQLKSMEFENWDFSPGMWYYILHNNGYSGAKLVWKWAGLKSRLVPEFKEERSKVKRVMHQRNAAAASELIFLQKSKEELDSITPIYNEEVARSLDRNVDIAYNNFKDDFKDLQTTISNNLAFCLQRSQGKLSKIIDQYLDHNDFLCKRIEYIHKTGVGYEMENTKREIAYEEARKDMQKLAAATENLVRYAAVNYNMR